MPGTSTGSPGLVQPRGQTHGSWFSRHKIWTAVLLFLVLAVATGAVLCTIF